MPSGDYVITITVPQASGQATVQGFCGTGGYVPPVDPVTKLPLGNDTLGCDSLGVPTAAGLQFAMTKYVQHGQEIAKAFAAQQIKTAADAQLAAAAAAIYGVPVTASVTNGSETVTVTVGGS